MLTTTLYYSGSHNGLEVFFIGGNDKGISLYNFLGLPDIIPPSISSVILPKYIPPGTQIPYFQSNAIYTVQGEGLFLEYKKFANLNCAANTQDFLNIFLGNTTEEALWAVLNKIVSTQKYGYYRKEEENHSNDYNDILENGYILGGDSWLLPVGISIAPNNQQIGETIHGAGWCVKRLFRFLIEAYRPTEGFSPLSLYNSKVWRENPPGSPYRRYTLFETLSEGWDATYYDAFVYNGQLYEGDYYDRILSHSSSWEDMHLTLFDNEPSFSETFVDKFGGAWNLTFASGGYGGILSPTTPISGAVWLGCGEIQGEILSIQNKKPARKKSLAVSALMPLLSSHGGLSNGGVPLVTDDGNWLIKGDGGKLTT